MSKPDRNSPSRWSRFKEKAQKPVLVVMLLVVGCAFYNGIAVSGTYTNCVVTDTHAGYKSQNNRVYAEGCNGSSEVKAFSVESNWLVGKFAPVSMSKFEVGKTYDFTVRGNNVPILLLTENIIEVSEK
jgi:hypothetical protein